MCFYKMSSRLTALKTALEELMRRGVCSLRYTRHMTPSGKAAERWDFKLRLLMTGLYIGLEFPGQDLSCPSRFVLRRATCITPQCLYCLSVRCRLSLLPRGASCGGCRSFS